MGHLRVRGQVDQPRVEHQGAARGDQEDRQQAAPHRTRLPAGSVVGGGHHLLRRREVLRLRQAPSQVQRVEAEDAADAERHAPAPGRHLLVGEQRVDGQAHECRQDRAHHHGHPRRRPEQPAPTLRRPLHEVGHGGAHLAAVRQALQQAGDDEDHRGEDAHRAVGGGEGDDQAAERGDHHRREEAALAAHPVRVGAEHVAADGAGDEAHREDGQGGEQLGGGVVRVEDLRREDRGEDRVDVPVVPLQRVAEVHGQHVLQAPGAGPGHGSGPGRAGGRGAHARPSRPAWASPSAPGTRISKVSRTTV